ncbi:CBO0543 family protein [Neobacillus sp. SAB-20_R2A]|uniref:CBO0543 family protein n=1 Tax=Neobacillus sp. SAB-20_R2A TaxID=3120519 RepID=UPI003C6E19B2
MWFLIISSVIFSVYSIFMPKKLTRIEIFSTIFFAMTLQDNVDIYLDGKYDLYGYFTKGIQWKTLIAIIGIYPAVTTIFLNYYPFKKQWPNKLVYIIVCSGFAVLYEYMAVKSGYFYHNGWTYTYSALSYPILFFILVIVLKIVRKLVRESI